MQKFSIMGNHFENNNNELEGFSLNKNKSIKNNNNFNSNSNQSEIDYDELMIEMEANKKQLVYIKQLYKESEKKITLLKEAFTNIINKYNLNKKDKIIIEDLRKLKELLG